ncbi:MAG: protein exod [Anaerolineaceae bacterium]|nr:protein exod [Anaerolineaceae bacterium]
MTFVEFRDTQKSLAATLSDVVNALPPGSITLRDLLALIGEQGMLFFCIIMTIPFLTPLPLPGISTVFGILIMLISIGVVFNRVPWLPRPLMNRQIACAQLAPVLQRGAQLFNRVERFIRPRIPALTHQSTVNRLNGLLLLLAGFLLILPLPVIPFSNMLPGWAILLLAAGMLQRDGIFVIVGYVLTLFSTFYLAGWAVAAVIAGQGLGTIFSGVILPVG